MKGNEKIIEKLNALLADELTAINQYMVHSEELGLPASPRSYREARYRGNEAC